MTGVEAATVETDDIRSAPPVLEVRDLCTEFGPPSRPIRAVRGVNFELLRGQTLVLLGESGSGKSVTARSVLRLYGSSARTVGEVSLDGIDLLTASATQMRSLRGKQVALVPQESTGALDPLRTIGGQIAEVLRNHGIVDGRRARRDRAEELLRSVGIPDPHRVARSFPHQLSGGMRQRAAIALAICCSPKVLIADEPTTALDVTVQAQILELFEDLQRDLHMTLLLVTHDVGVAEQMGNRVAVMYAGRIVEAGPADDVLDRPAHPYTKALLASVPTPGVGRGDLHPIPGRAVLAGEEFAGCPFAQRCPRATAACTVAEPGLRAVGPDRSAACIHPLEQEGA